MAATKGKAPPVVEFVKSMGPREFARVVRTYGPKCAAWLVRSHGARFRRWGFVEFTVPRKAEEPVWFRVAIATLRTRPSFNVQITSSSTHVRYLVMWLRVGERSTVGASIFRDTRRTPTRRGVLS